MVLAVGLVPLEHPQGEVEDVDALFLNGEAGLPEGLAEAEVEAGEGERGLELVVGVAGGGSVGVFSGFGKEGQEFGGDVGRGFVCTVCVLGNGLLAGGPRASVPHASGPFPFQRGEEVHDPFGADEDLEEFAGEFVDDFEAPAFRRAKVEEGVAKREVEDVAAGFLEFVADGRRFGHFYNLVQELTRIRQSGSFCRVV